MSNFETHVKSDTIKWILTLIAFILVGVMLAGIICGWFDKKEEQKEETKSVDSGFELTTPDEGDPSAPETASQGIALMSAVIPREEYAAQAIAASTEKAYTLSATITPSDADNQTVDWAVAFINPSSSWASGKTVTDYVTITPQSDGSKTATAQCLKAFGEQIKITVTSRENAEAKAECIADYVARIARIEWTMGSSTGTHNVTTGGGNGSMKILPDSETGECAIEHQVICGDHTKSANYYLDYKQFDLDYGRFSLDEVTFNGGTTHLKQSDCSVWYNADCLTVKNIVEHCFQKSNAEAQDGAKRCIARKIKSGVTQIGLLTFCFKSSDEGATTYTGSMYITCSAADVMVYVGGASLDKSNILF